jgi:S-adenosylmethionine hydrolase
LPLVTLTTDIGAPYAAQIRGVLLSAVPGLRVVDLALDLAPHDLAEGAFLFEHMAAGFPAGSIHLAIVDPGVGGRRDPLAVRTSDGSTLLGPDNGLMDRLARRLGISAAVRLDPPRVARRERVGTTFDGRDLFAPAAARLALGAALEEIGARREYRPSGPAPPTRSTRGAAGRIAHIDRFGNLISDVPSAWAPVRGRAVAFQMKDGPWRPVAVVRSYESLPKGAFGLLPSSFGTLELALREDRASDGLGAHVGALLRLRWEPWSNSRGKRK